MPPWLVRGWQCLIRAYPPEFRYEFGPEMLRALEDRYGEERGASRLRLCLATAADLLWTAAKERWYLMIRDIRHSCRRFALHPLVTLIAVLSLALGVGANTTVFSIVWAALLRPLPYPDVDRRVVLMSGAGRSSPGMGVTTADFIDWRDGSRTLEQMHMFSSRTVFTAVGAGLPERVKAQHVTPGLFEALGARPVIGRFFRPGEEQTRPAVISEGYWRRRFGGQTDVLGRKLHIGDGVHTIIGVAPSWFELFDEPSGIDIWNTINLSPGSIWVQRRVAWLAAMAKLREGVTIEQARAELAAIAAGIAERYPETNKDKTATMVPLVEARKGGAGSVLYPLLGAVAFVLLIACTNVANLLLARAATRRREISVRAALGAGRDRLIREFLVDGLVLAVPAVVLAIAVAYGGVALFRALAPDRFPGVATVALNLPVLWFTGGAGLLAGLLSAMIPAVDASRADLTESLKEGARGSGSRKRQRVRSVLVTAEIGLAVVLLTGAGLLIGTVLRMQNFDMGFDPRDVTVAEINLSGTRYMKNAPQREIDMRYIEPAVPLFLEHVLREVRAVAGVESAGLGGSVPMGPMGFPLGAGVRVAGQTQPDAQLPGAMLNAVTGSFFEALRIPLRRGRFIEDRDTAGSQWVAVVNESFAREFFPDKEALGQTITLAGSPAEAPREIVGVVADHTQLTPRMPVRAEVYTSYFQQPREVPGTMQQLRLRPKLVVRMRPGASMPSTAVSKIVAAFDPTLAVFDVSPLSRHIAMRSSTTRFYAYALGFFATIAVLLAAAGIYGLMNYSVADRFHEIGIRLSLGASRGRVLWLIVAHGLRLAAVGLVVGVAGALWTTRLLQGFLFGVEPWDPATFVGVGAAVFALAVAASVVPALRATRVDPVLALRRE